VKEEKLFGDAVVEEIRVKIQSKGLEGIDIKELLVLVADYFNDSTSNIQNMVTDGTNKIQNMVTDGTNKIQKMVTDSTNKIQKMVHGTLGALWAIFAGIIASLIAGLIIAIITLK